MPREEATMANQPSKRIVAPQRGPRYGVDAEFRLKTNMEFLSGSGRDLDGITLLPPRSGLAVGTTDDGRSVGLISVFHHLLFFITPQISLFS